MKLDEVVIRPALLEDAKLLAELGARTFYETFAAMNTPEDMAAYLHGAFSPAKQAQELAEEESFFWIAETEEQAIGYFRLHDTPAPECVRTDHPIELVRLYVCKEWIGTGVGGLLMQTCIQAARKLGGDALWLSVWQKNPRAIAFYKKWGFVKVGKNIFQIGSDLQNDDFMQLDL